MFEAQIHRYLGNKMSAQYKAATGHIDASSEHNN
jgi:hypothetical protein